MCRRSSAPSLESPVLSVEFFDTSNGYKPLSSHTLQNCSLHTDTSNGYKHMSNHILQNFNLHNDISNGYKHVSNHILVLQNFNLHTDISNGYKHMSKYILQNFSLHTDISNPTIICRISAFTPTHQMFYKHLFSHTLQNCSLHTRGEFRPKQTRQLPRAVDLRRGLLSCQSY